MTAVPHDAVLWAISYLTAAPAALFSQQNSAAYEQARRELDSESGLLGRIHGTEHAIRDRVAKRIAEAVYSARPESPLIATPSGDDALADVDVEEVIEECLSGCAEDLSAINHLRYLRAQRLVVVTKKVRDRADSLRRMPFAQFIVVTVAGLAALTLGSWWWFSLPAASLVLGFAMQARLWTLQRAQNRISDRYRDLSDDSRDRT